MDSSESRNINLVLGHEIIYDSSDSLFVLGSLYNPTTGKTQQYIGFGDGAHIQNPTVQKVQWNPRTDIMSVLGYQEDRNSQGTGHCDYWEAEQLEYIVVDDKSSEVEVQQVGPELNEDMEFTVRSSQLDSDNTCTLPLSGCDFGSDGSYLLDSNLLDSTASGYAGWFGVGGEFKVDFSDQ